MAHKVLLTWNIQSGIEREQFQRIRIFVSKLSGLGLDLADAWYTAYGDAPQVLLGIVAAGGQDDQLQSILDSEEWGELLAEWYALGVTHVEFSLMGAGLQTVDEYLTALRRFKESPGVVGD